MVRIAVCLLLLFFSSVPQAYAKKKVDLAGQSKCPSGQDDFSDQYYEVAFKAALKDGKGWAAQSCSMPNVDVCSQEGDLNQLTRELDDDYADALKRIPEKCISTAMRRRGDANKVCFYTKCTGPTGAGNPGCFAAKSGVKRVPPPAVSQDYVTTTRVSLAAAARCLNEDPRFLYTMFAKESNLQVNVGNTTGDWGAAQMHLAATSPSGFANVFSKELAQRPECWRFTDMVKAMENVKKATPCLVTHTQLDKMSGLPVNPARSFLMGGITYIQRRRMIEKLLEQRIPPKATKSLSKAKSKAKKEREPLINEKLSYKLSARERIIRHISLSAYNAGPGYVIPCVENMIIDNPQAFQSYEAFAAAYPDYMEKNYGKGTVKKWALDEEKRKDAANAVAAYPENVFKRGKQNSDDAKLECAIYE